MGTHTTISKDFVIRNEYGIHARPAALLVRCASRFASEVDISKDGITVSGKSIMGLLTLEGFQGCTITVIVTGEDAKEALEALAELIESNFGE